MSLQRQREEIENYFFTEFGALRPLVPITGENADFDPPTDIAWVRISFQVADQFRTCIGQNEAYRTEGIIFLQIFTPISEGSKEATEIADDILSIFRAPTTMNRVVVLNSSISFAGVSEGSYQVNVVNNYRAEE